MEDIDQLIHSCRSDSAKQHIVEAYAAYSTGAFRATITSCWIAYVFDYVDKMIELAAVGDANAKSVLEDFHNIQKQVSNDDPEAIKKSLQFERSVIDRSHKQFEFLDHQGAIDIQRLRDDRNRCAHPTYQKDGLVYQPSAELARLHLVNVIRHALSQAPSVGKSIVDQVASLAVSATFPRNVDEARKYLEASGFEKPRDSAVRNAIDRLVFGLFDPSSPLHLNYPVIFAIGAISRISPEIARDRIKVNVKKCIKNVDVEKLFAVIPLCHVVQDLQYELNDGEVIKIVGSLKQSKSSKINTYFAWAANMSKFHNYVFPLIKEVKNENLKEIAAESKDERIIQIIVDRYLTVKSWDRANSVFSELVEDNVLNLNETQLISILDAASEGTADLRGSHGFNKLIEAIYELGKPVGSKKLTELLIERELKSFAHVDEG